MKTRTCSKCQKEKTLEDSFYPSKCGYESACKQCRNISKYNRRIQKRVVDGLPVRAFTNRQISKFFDEGLKYCPGCKVIKTIEEFNKLHKKQSCHCKQCVSDMAYERYNKAEEKRKRSDSYQKNKRQGRNKKLQKKFGITIDEYEVKLATQNNLCAICGLSDEDNNKALAVDHNHTTGQVRDLLCNNCNVAVGFIKERVDLCDSIKQYILKHRR